MMRGISLLAGLKYRLYISFGSEKEVSAAKLSLDMSLVQLDVGEATFLDVLEAQSTKTQARQGLIFNVIEYNCAQVQLLFDAGIITVGDIIEKLSIEQIDEMDKNDMLAWQKILQEKSKLQKLHISL